MQTYRTKYRYWYGVLRLEVGVFITCAIPRIRKILLKLLRIEMETNHIIMAMGIHSIEPPWASIYLMHTYQTKYRYWYA
jgi:hypothetical protein